MGLPQHAFQWAVQPSSSINLGTTTQYIRVASSATVTFGGDWEFGGLRLTLSSTISLGSSTQVIRVGPSASVTFEGAWPVARAVHVHKNGTNQLNITPDVATKVTLSNADFDALATFDNTNDRITPNVAGKWRFKASAGWVTSLAAGSYVITELRKTGTAFTLGRQTVGPVAQNPVYETDAIINMNGTTDYVEVFVTHGHTATATLSGAVERTFLEAMYLGA